MKIVMVPVNPDTSLFLYKIVGDELVFRSSYNYSHLQTEKMVLKDGMCYVGPYYFPVDCLKLIDPEEDPK